MKAYKEFKKHEDGTLWCRDFQYEVGKTYTFDSYPILCEQGFHACHNLHQCWVFYANNGYNVYYEVECGGSIVESGTDDGKLVCTEITLVREIPAPENKVDNCDYFNRGYARVLLNDRCNFINTDGKFISKQWFDWCGSFYNGFAVVNLNGKWFKLGKNGKWFKLDKKDKLIQV